MCFTTSNIWQAELMSFTTSDTPDTAGRGRMPGRSASAQAPCQGHGPGQQWLAELPAAWWCRRSSAQAWCTVQKGWTLTARRNRTNRWTRRIRWCRRPVTLCLYLSSRQRPRFSRGCSKAGKLYLCQNSIQLLSCEAAESSRRRLSTDSTVQLQALFAALESVDGRHCGHPWRAVSWAALCTAIQISVSRHLPM